jgi:hypothetical protein
VKLLIQLTTADFASLLASFLPLSVRLSREEDRYFAIGSLKSFALVPNVGLRAEVAARIHWEALGIGLPLSGRSVRLLVRPSVPAGSTKLAFLFQVEDADIVGMPGIFDQTVVDKANQALARTHLSWDFGHTLGRAFPLSDRLSPVSRLLLRAEAGEVAIGDDGLSLAIDLSAATERDRPLPQGAFEP